MRIRLSEERRNELLVRIKLHCREHFDDEIGDLKAQLLLDFFVQELGPPVYNQAVRDAHDFMAEKLVDLEGEFYEPESER